jgi:hypothetical protein
MFFHPIPLSLGESECLWTTFPAVPGFPSKDVLLPTMYHLEMTSSCPTLEPHRFLEPPLPTWGQPLQTPPLAGPWKAPLGLDLSQDGTGAREMVEEPLLLWILPRLQITCPGGIPNFPGCLTYAFLTEICFPD